MSLNKDHLLKQRRRESSSQSLERVLAVVALGILLIAWIIGTFRAEADLGPFMKQALPDADHFEPISGSTYAAWKDQSRIQLMGYVTTGSAHGYGGKIKMVIATSLEGKVVGLAVVDHKETVSFFQRVLKSDLLNSLKGKAHSDPFTLGQDLDGVTGATYSSRALADVARKASRKIATENLGFPPILEPSPQILFGFPEAVLIVLFAVGIVARLRLFQYRRIVRWISMLVGMIVLGFVYNKPLTLVLINKMLLGFWPEWQLHLYWYLLVAGILFVYTIDNRNPYCEWFCPFGATQECLGIIGGAKARMPERIHYPLRWFQRVLALTAIGLALVYRNPSVSSYEVFGAFFHLIGTTFNFSVLGIVLIAALFIKRPWCSYLCPLRPVTDFIRLIRNWGGELLIKLRLKPAFRG